MIKNSKKRDNRFQKKLNHTEKENEVTEYEVEFLKNPEPGPLIADEIYAELYSLEFFTSKRINNYRTRLTKSMAKFIDDYKKVEAGLASYAVSAVTKTRRLAILVKSITNTYENILLENYHSSGDAIKQLINISYFETLEWIEDFKLDDAELISNAGLRHYRKRANDITIRAMKDWFKYMLKKEGDSSLAQHYEQLIVHKGVNHAKYYKEKQYKTDMLAMYTGMQNEPFFENVILSSYTLSADVAGKFVSGTPYSKGQRRLLIDGNPEIIEGRIFFSWIVSDSFINGQYEILCLPNDYPLLINWKIYDEIFASFALFKNPTPAI